MNAAEASTATAIEVSTFTAGNQVIVTVRNTGEVEITRLHAELRRDGVAAGRGVEVPRLGRGQSIVFQLPSKRSKGSYVVVSGIIGDNFNETAVPIKGADNSTLTSQDWLSLATGMLGLIGVVIGALLSNFAAARRDHSRMRFEVRQQDSSAYQVFLERWDRSLSASQLEAARQQLRVRVPAEIETLYNRTLEILKDSSIGKLEKEASVEVLYLAVRERI